MRKLAIYLAAGLLAAAISPATIAPTAAVGAEQHSSASAGLRSGMRKLWEDHITYTRNYIISALADLPDQESVAKRLLANQDEIGNAVKPYYGDEAGQKLAALLKDHIVIATEVVQTAKDGNNDALEAAQKKWSANGNDIAVFLAGANPNWPEATLKEMLQKHLDLTSGGSSPD